VLRARIVLGVSVIAVVLAACGGGGATSSTSGPAGGSTASSANTEPGATAGAFGPVTVSEDAAAATELFDGMPNIGGNPVSFGTLYTFEEMRTLTQGRLSMQGRLILMPEHTGTHIDVPAHFLEDGLTTSELPLERLVVPGHALDLSHVARGAAITVADLEEAEKASGRPIAPGTALLVHTGADEYWGQPGFSTNRPYVPVESGEWLVDKRISLFGTDLIGMDDPDEWWWSTHKVWLTNGVPMVQQLCNLGRLVGRNFTFIALPLKMATGTASPVRAIALVE
jgi:arylformamidase